MEWCLLEWGGGGGEDEGGVADWLVLHCSESLCVLSAKHMIALGESGGGDVHFLRRSYRKGEIVLTHF